MSQVLPVLGFLVLLQPGIASAACSISTPIEVKGDNNASKGSLAQAPCDSSASAHQVLSSVAAKVVAPKVQQSAISSERTRIVLTQQQIEQAIRLSLGADERDAQIRILDFDRSPVPSGTVQFPVSGAVLPDSAEPRRPFIWRGMVLGDLGNDSPCWARVQIVVNRKVVRTTARLLAGAELDPSELEAVQVEACPLITPRDEEVSDYVGLLLRRAVPTLAVLSKAIVETPPLVRRGTTVRVTAMVGQARISLEGEAHSDGRLGQGIQVTNVQTGRSFLAKVNGKGSVLVDLTGPSTP